MKNMLLVAISLLVIGVSSPVLAKDCGSDCRVCYCTFNNGTTCVEDNPALGSCNCRCVQQNKSADIGGHDIDAAALQSMINSYLEQMGFEYTLESAQFANKNASAASKDKSAKGLFGKKWRCRIVPNGLSCESN